MASIGNEGDGRKRVLFVAGDGSRKTIRIGKASMRQAERFKGYVESLIVAGATGSRPDDETSRWLAGLGKVIYARLVAVGLVKAREDPGAVRVGKFIDDYLAQRGDLRKGTLAVMESARRTLVSFLGEGKHLDEVTVGDADAYRSHLLSTKAKATTNKWCRYARHYFEVARRRRMILENPFAHIRGAVRGVASKRLFIPAADVQKVIDGCPDPQWKLLIALARFGGLRIPSEAIELTWRDVDVEHNRFIVRATKTAHHDDGGVRVVPMFPELAPLFQAVYDAAPDGAVHVITRYRDAGQNLRTQFERYIVAAGLKPWGKLWQNLRVSRATELADIYPSHVCAAWLGHTEKIADEFYRLTTDEHFKRATEVSGGRAVAHSDRPTDRPTKTGVPDSAKPVVLNSGGSGGCLLPFSKTEIKEDGKWEAPAQASISLACGFPTAASAAQNPAQYGAVSSIPTRENDVADNRQSIDLPYYTECNRLIHNELVGDEGFERATKVAEKLALTQERGTESGTLPADSDLAYVVATWMTLTPATRAAVLALVNATPRSGE